MALRPSLFLSPPSPTPSSFFLLGLGHSVPGHGRVMVEAYVSGRVVVVTSVGVWFSAVSLHAGLLRRL